MFPSLFFKIDRKSHNFFRGLNEKKLVFPSLLSFHSRTHSQPCSQVMTLPTGCLGQANHRLSMHVPELAHYSNLWSDGISQQLPLSLWKGELCMCVRMKRADIHKNNNTSLSPFIENGSSQLLLAIVFCCCSGKSNTSLVPLFNEPFFFLFLFKDDPFW